MMSDDNATKLRAVLFGPDADGMHFDAEDAALITDEEVEAIMETEPLWQGQEGSRRQELLSELSHVAWYEGAEGLQSTAIDPAKPEWLRLQAVRLLARRTTHDAYRALQAVSRFSINKAVSAAATEALGNMSRTLQPLIGRLGADTDGFPSKVRSWSSINVPASNRLAAAANQGDKIEGHTSEGLSYSIRERNDGWRIRLSAEGDAAAALSDKTVEVAFTEAGAQDLTVRLMHLIDLGNNTLGAEDFLTDALDRSADTTITIAVLGTDQETFSNDADPR